MERREMVLKILRNLFLIRNEKTGKEKWIDEGVWAEYEPEVWSKVENCTIQCEIGREC